MELTGETILVVDDDPYIQQALEDRLASLGHGVLVSADGKEALEIVERERPQLVLLDIEIPGMKGLDVLKEIRRRELDIPVIMITAYGSIDMAVQAMKEGAYDFIPKPFKSGHIGLVVQKAIERQRLRTEVDLLSEEVDSRYRLVAGKSSKMSEAIDAAKKAAASRSTVLLLGESGTGKELFARAIHNWSDRKKRSFVAINCVGLSKELLESDLFGHEKGSFTGAYQLKKGKMEIAHGGTVFLDEIGDVSAELQTKLLRFLQEREFERIGGTRAIRVDVRIIAATNRDLQAAMKQGNFREDLYYRLNVVPIKLPPLREHKEDIPELARFFADRFANETKRPAVDLIDSALSKLMAYDWPGNVRELANIIERAVVLGQDPAMQAQDLAAEIVNSQRTPASGPRSDYNGEVCLDGKTINEVLEQTERRMIHEALSKVAGNKQRAARLLGLSRQGLVKKLKRFGITP